MKISQNVIMDNQPRKPNVQIKEDDGVSRLGAINVGQYPLHHFAHEFDEESTRNLPLFLRFAGFDEWVRGCYRVRKSSNTFALELVREGVFVFVQNGRSHEVYQDMMFIVHREGDSEISVNSDYAAKQTVSLDGRMLYPILEQTGLVRHSCLTLREPDKFIRLFDRANSILSRRDNDYLLQGSVLAYQILLELGTMHHLTYPEPLPDIMSYINRNLHRPLSLIDLCHTFAIGRTSLYRLFMEHLKISVGDYIIARRLQVAQNLLQNTDYPIKEVAARAGYSNQLYFAAEFKRLTGETPRDYRKRVSCSIVAEFHNVIRDQANSTPSVSS